MTDQELERKIENAFKRMLASVELYIAITLPAGRYADAEAVARVIRDEREVVLAALRRAKAQ